jgi:hypothetical protein
LAKYGEFNEQQMSRMAYENGKVEWMNGKKRKYERRVQSEG